VEYQSTSLTSVNVNTDTFDKSAVIYTFLDVTLALYVPSNDTICAVLFTT